MRKLFLVCLLLSGTAYADGISFNVSGDTLNVSYNGRIAGLQWGASYLRSSDNDTSLATIGVASVAPLSKGSPIFAGVGTEFSYITNDAGDGGGLSVSGLVGFRPNSFKRLSVSARVSYMPEILTFGDVDEATSFEVRGSYQITQNASVYVGYRTIEYDIDGDEQTIDSGIHAGVHYGFQL